MKAAILTQAMATKHHIEQEIKLTAPNGETLERLIDAPLVQQFVRDKEQNFAAQRYAATYYDCPDWTLMDRRWSLRTRFEGARHVGTLKRRSTIKDGFSSCEEYEQAVETGFSQVASIPQGKIADALLEILPASTQLIPRVSVTMQRRMRELGVGNTHLELVTDTGTISANGQQLDLFEVELELLQGDLHEPAVQAFIQTLQRTFALHPSSVSKHQLGLACYPQFI